MRLIASILFVLLTWLNSLSQIVIDNTAPYNTAPYLVDNILLGGGVIASNHTFQGEPSQIGFFNAINTNLGIDSGIVMACGDIYTLDPIVGSSFPFLPNTNTVQIVKNTLFQIQIVDFYSNTNLDILVFDPTPPLEL